MKTQTRQRPKLAPPRRCIACGKLFIPKYWNANRIPRACSQHCSGVIAAKTERQIPPTPEEIEAMCAEFRRINPRLRNGERCETWEPQRHKRVRI